MHSFLRLAWRFYVSFKEAHTVRAKGRRIFFFEHKGGFCVAEARRKTFPWWRGKLFPNEDTVVLPKIPLSWIRSQTAAKQSKIAFTRSVGFILKQRTHVYYYVRLPGAAFTETRKMLPDWTTCGSLKWLWTELRGDLFSANMLTWWQFGSPTTLRLMQLQKQEECRSVLSRTSKKLTSAPSEGSPPYCHFVCWKESWMGQWTERCGGPSPLRVGNSALMQQN